MIGEKEFYCSIDNKCTKCYCVGGSVKFETTPELFGDHLEVDTKHAEHADIKGSGNIIVQGTLDFFYKQVRILSGTRVI